ncbi:hypothetical protein HZH66_007449 [Vespula vulgaris]|uniref:Uncharacterized protein n=1 Tax=Vespula vulgaris TaxID=7454 RepID=A0A834N538_VESVU|nr:hypothetical protein HZH66_007449 [Vespula vulgaris]
MKERIRRHSIEALASSNGQTVKKLTFLREYHTSTVIAEVVVAGNGNVLGTAMTNTTAIATRTSTTLIPMTTTTMMTTMATMRPLDIQLPPTLPMTFATENATTIPAQSGSTALLPCVVHNLGDGVFIQELKNLKVYLFFDGCIILPDKSMTLETSYKKLSSY